MQPAALETCQEVEKGEARAGSSLASRLRALGGHVSRRVCAAPSTWASSEGSRCVVEVSLRGEPRGRGVGAMSSRRALRMKWRWRRLTDALAAAAAETLAEDFETSCSPTLLTPASP